MDNTFIRQKLIPRLTFNPGLALTGFRTTRPRVLTITPWDLAHDTWQNLSIKLIWNNVHLSLTYWCQSVFAWHLFQVHIFIGKYNSYHSMKLKLRMCFLLYLFVSTRAVIGQFSRPYSIVRPMQWIEAWMKNTPWFSFVWRKLQYCHEFSDLNCAESHGVMASTLDSESSDPSSNLGGTWLH